MLNNEDKKTIELEESIASIEEKIDEVSSPLNVFKRGLIKGFGSAIGATIIFAIVMSLLTWFVSTTDIPWIKSAVQELRSDEVLSN